MNRVGATREGTAVWIACTRCGGMVVYNGNYFCTECDWALPAQYPLRGAARREVFEFHLAVSAAMAERGNLAQAEWHAQQAASVSNLSERVTE